MRRSVFVCLGILAVSWVEFQIFPGHSYLQSGTLIYLPVLERLDTPGYLSRDLIATSTSVSYTIYDEVTLFAHDAARLDFKKALILQQFLFRAAAVAGIFLLARETGLSGLLSMLVAALVNLGAMLPGPAACITGPEPVPSEFAFGAAVLAMGLLAGGKPLFSGFVAGVAFLYDPVIAAPFWAVVLLEFLSSRESRARLKPMLPILAVFVLLLANLIQLQPGVSSGQSLFAKVSPSLAELQWMRTPYVWTSTWAGREIWNYLAIFVFGIWAAARIWPLLNRQMRWLVMGVSAMGLASVLCSYLLLDELRLAVMARIQPSRTLVFTVALSSLLCALAGMSALFRRRRWEALGWFAFVLALPVNAQIFSLPRPGPVRVASLPSVQEQSIAELASWAESSTWGSSLFLFPDAGRQLYPGIFRAESRRALWADWKSGVVVDYPEPVGSEWWARWQETMEGPYSPARLRAMLPLPIDYYVLRRQNKLASVKAVFANREFMVYDAEDLRAARLP
jgi:hypothetical protein